MRINTNINSMRTQEYMRQNQDKMNVSMNRLSSGKRINSAADDAAGLAIATRMKAREGGLSVAARNTQDGMSLIRTAESAMNSVSNILLRMRDLATQSANGANTKGNQASLQKEFAELKNQIAYISDNTQFNDQNLLKDDSTITIQTMDSSSASQQVGVELSSVSLGALSLSDVVIGKELSNAASLTEASDAASARAAISAIDAALAKVAGNRATLGATLNRLDFNVESLNNQATNMAATASQIEDADMAKEMSEMTKFKILNEAGISMLSQANQTPQMVSKLLQ
ncbi:MULTISPECIES: flagellin N-terminal helical domain-containing protein [Bacillus cereus group]|uniref:flagellin N-terminal helical domain-containing protein n=1 Tax=Bacillus cereus group TaxID=86661 RepID=UPI0007788414|nr:MULTISPECIES: flagellin [Bacillus cereus group]KXY88423.1 flagellin [Bacillus cereus]MCC2537964.1 flagellin [Bacillus paranthracis]MCU5385825.1 flagellin [Bacillus cereus]MDA1617231.1 flagellin [Bacillus cereus group sp. TH204-1LC]MDX5882072.1 flagellin [Bacillus cereus group sp. BfR-BA-00999]